MVANVVANGGNSPGDDDVLALLDELIAEGQQVDEAPRSWRLEQTARGYWRWRWQLKEPDGSPVTYTTSGGKRGYRRGSRYVGKIDE